MQDRVTKKYSLQSCNNYVAYLTTGFCTGCRPAELHASVLHIDCKDANISSMGKHAEASSRNILVSFDISSIAGRDQLSGVLRYLRSRPQWTPRLVANPVDFTPALVREARSAHVDGIIVNHAGSTETERALAESDVPLAVVGIRSPVLLSRKSAIAFIRNDNIETGRIAAQYFRSLGNFRSFGYIPAAHPGEEWSTGREYGFRTELNRYGRRLSVFQGAADAGASLLALAEWLVALQKPAAVFAAWDYPAMQALEVCRSERLKVPHDVAVLGVDNDSLVCDATVPPLSSIPFDYERQGYESAAALAVLFEKPAAHLQKPLTVMCRPLPVFVRESATATSPASDLLKRAMRYIAKNAAKGISMRDVARDLGVSQSLLSLRFREFSGGTVMDAVIAARIEKAKHLLATTSRSIKDITAASGFRNANYMKSTFKRIIGMTMRDYRTKMQKTTKQV